MSDEKIAYLKKNMGDILIDVEEEDGEIFLHFINFVLQVSIDDLHVAPIEGEVLKLDLKEHM